MRFLTSGIFKYLFMPQILPRLGDLWKGGFGFIAFTIACLFESARLLTPGHAYVNPANIGRYTLFQVMGQAASNLRFRRENMDQVLLFFFVLAGFVLLVAQIALFAFSIFTQTAFAGDGGGTPFFVTHNPATDIAFIVLDRVFGIPGIFNSCVARNIPCVLSEYNTDAISGGVFPQPMHLAYQGLLEFYSIGLLCVAAVIFSYHVVTIVVETAKTGTPFGKRFNRVWAPVRLIIALGLLIPIAHGLNAAQYIGLYAAKMGSGFATNAYYHYAAAVSSGGRATLLGDAGTLIAKPQYPPVNELVQFMSLAWTCEIAYERLYGFRDDADLGTTADERQKNYDRINIRAWFVKEGPPESGRLAVSASSGMTYDEIQKWFNYGDIAVVFGDFNPAFPEKYKGHRGGVRPYCGQVNLASAPGSGGLNADGPLERLARDYFDTFIYMPWFDDGNMFNFETLAENIVNRTAPISNDRFAPMLTQDDKANVIIDYQAFMQALVDSAFEDFRDNSTWSDSALQHGWAGAGIWYNNIMKMNGDFVQAMTNLPSVTKLPELMEFVLAAKANDGATIQPDSAFIPYLSSGKELVFSDTRDRPIAMALYETEKVWRDFSEYSAKGQTGQPGVDMVQTIFSETGLISFRENETQHPMASLIVLGKSLLTKSVLAFGGGGVFGMMGRLGDGKLTKFMGGFASTFMNVAFMGLVIGFMLAYVIPLMPFMYFLFAIMTWIKSIFEAMVGLPLWALAHLRFDGDGFPTRQAMGGYYLLLDIFLRPVLIVFGMIASSLLFYALARTMNNTFILAVSNLSGFDYEASKTVVTNGVGSIRYLRGLLDQVFFTIIYAVIVYMLGLSCFKMIDQIPNSIMKWIGSSATSFAAMAKEDAGEAMRGSIKQGSLQASGQIGAVAQGLTGGAVRPDSD